MEERNNRKMAEGVVVSDKMDRTAVIEVQRVVKHKLYGKVMKRTKKYKIHDENNECKIGDRIRVMETRPLSKDKRWRLLEIIKKAE